MLDWYAHDALKKKRKKREALAADETVFGKVRTIKTRKPHVALESGEH